MAKGKYIWDSKQKKYILEGETGGSSASSSASASSAVSRAASAKKSAEENTQWQSYLQKARVRAAAKDMQQESSKLGAYGQKVSDGLYRVGAKDSLKLTGSNTGSSASKLREYGKTLKNGIALLGLSDEENEKLLSSADEAIKSASSIYALARARTGDSSVLEEAEGDEYNEYLRLLRLAGYDTADALVKEELPGGKQKAARESAQIDVELPEDYDFNSFGDDIYRARYGEEKDGTKLTDEARQQIKARIEALTGVEDFDALSTAEQLNLTYDEDYIEQMNRLSGGAETWQDVLDTSEIYTEEDIRKDVATVKDQLEGHVRVNPDEYSRAIARLGAAGADGMTGFGMLTGEDRAELDAKIAEVSRELGLESEFTVEDYMGWLENALANERETDRTEAEQAKFDAEIGEKYGAYRNAADFAEQSQPGAVELSDMTEAKRIWAAVNGMDGGELYEGNRLKAAIYALNPEAERYNENTVTDEQRDMFNYLWNAQGEAAALEYLKDIEWSVNRGMAAQSEQIGAELGELYSDTWMGETPLDDMLASLGSVAASPFRATVAPINALRAAGGEEIDEYDPSFNPGREFDAVEQATGEKLDEALGGANVLGWNIGSGVYGGAMSILKNLMLYPLGAGGASAVMGLEAGDSAMRDALEDGRGIDNALMDAGATAVIEMLTERIGMDRLFGDVGSPLKYAASSTLSEGLEEVVSEGASLLYDAAKYGDTSELGEVYDRLHAMGYSDDEAIGEMLKEIGSRLYNAAMSGMAGGAFGAAPRAAATAAADVSMGGQISESDGVSALLDIADTVELSEDTQAIVQQLRNTLKGTEANVQQADDAIDAAQGADMTAAQENTQEDAQTDEEPEDAQVRRLAEEQAAQTQTAQAEQPGRIAQARTNAKLGRVYREVMAAVDEKAQAVVSDHLAGTQIRSLIRERSGYMDSAQPTGAELTALSRATAKAIAQPESMSVEERAMVASSSAAMSVVQEMTAQIEERRRQVKAQKQITAPMDALNARISETKTKNTAKNADKGAKTAAKNADTAIKEADTGAAGFDLQATAEREYGKNADLMTAAFEEGQDPQLYARQFRSAYQYGVDGLNAEGMRSGAATSMLTDAQYRIAYELGRGVRTAQGSGAQRTAAGAQTVKVDKSGIRGVRLTRHQSAAVEAMSALSEALGINVRFVESIADETGAYTTENGSWDPNTLTLTLDIHAGSNYAADAGYAMMDTAGHELTHFIRQMGDSALWEDYVQFVTGQLSGKLGAEGLEAEIEAKQAQGLSREDAIEEVIADASARALSRIRDEDIRQLGEEHPKLFERIRDWIVDWVAGIKKKIRAAYEGTDGRREVARQMEDVLDEMAAKWNRALVSAAENTRGRRTKTAEKANDNQDAVKYSARDGIEFAEDKYYARLIDNFEDQKPGGYVKVGKILEGCILNDVGLPAADLYFDNSKIARALAEHADHLSKEILKSVPEMLRNPVVISEDSRPGNINVFGDIWIGNSPVLVGIVIAHDASGRNVINKVRTVHAKRNAADKLGDESILYLDSDKKRTRKWFQTLGTHLPLGGTKFGFIRSIAESGENVKRQTREGVSTSDRDAYGDVKYSARDGIEFAEDKYYARLIDSIDEQKEGSYIRVGMVREGSVLNKVGLPAAPMYFDVSKIRDGMDKHGDHLDADVYKKIPGILNDPVVVTADKRQNNINVFGNLWVGNSPVLIGIVISKDRSGRNVINKIRTVHARKDAAGKIDDNSVLYLSENKKRTRAWFQALGTHLPLGGTKFGFIRSIAESGENVKRQTREGVSTSDHDAYGDVKFSLRDNSDEANTMRDQIRSRQNALNNMKPVADKTVDLPSGRDKTSKIDWAMKQLEDSGYEVDRPGFGRVVFDRKRIKTSLGYIHAKDDGRLAAIVAIPEVLRDGIEVGVHYDHKDRRYPSVTFAAPVVINGVRGNMAVAVIQTNANNYRAHRILMPDGSGFEFVQKNNAVTGTPGRAGESPRLNQSTETASENSIAESDDSVKRQTREGVSTSDRALLAEMMESAASNETERDFVKRYRKKFDELARKQQELEKVHERIRSLMDDGVKKNRDELIKERNRERLLSNYIDRYDTELLKWEASKPIREVIARQRKETAARVREQKDESAGRKKYRAKIDKDVKQLRQWLISPTNKGHVPELLRKPVGEFIEALDEATARSWSTMPETKTAQKFIQAMKALRTALEKARSEDSGEYIGYIDLPSRYIEVFGEMTDNIEKQLQAGMDMTGDPLRGMTAQQLRDLSELIGTLSTSIRQMNDFLANARYTSAIAAAQDSIQTLKELGEKKDGFKAGEGISDFMNWKNTTPYYAFKRFGDGGKAVFEGLMDGWDKLARNSKNAIDYAEAAYTAKEVRKWAKEIHEIELKQDGESVKARMTTAQIMSLYCLSRREQAQRHLAGGGIRIAEIDAGAGRRIRQAANYTLTDADVRAITGELTGRQIEVADKLQKYMQGTCAQWGNEVSMKRFGYNAFTEENYFPIETDSNNRKAVDEEAREQDLYRLLNLSATKALTPKANNAIVIRDIFDVFAAHTSDMAKYNALALPILDALKWYNYVEKTDPDEDGSFETRSVQKSIERAYGGVAKKYIMSFLKDLNGTNESGRNDGVFNKMISRSKIASVGANVRVYALQLTSMPRAAYAISPRYLTAGMAKASAHIARSMREAEEKVGIALWKSLGFYDTNISRSVKGMLKHDQSAVEWLREKSMTVAGMMDGVTMAVIYEAAKAEIGHRRPNLTGAARDKAINDRVREIVYQTQVVDSTMTRSDLMRSKGVASLSTAFMSEPTLTMNMLNDSIFEMQMNRRSGQKNGAAMVKLTRAVALYGFVGTISAIVEAAFDAARDEDEYESFAQKFRAAFIGEAGEYATGWDRFKAVAFSNLGSNLNLLNSIPVLSDAMSILEGYGNTAMYTQWLESLMSAWEAYKKYESGAGGYTAYTWIYNGLKGVSQAVGLPMSNAAREATSAWNTFIADKAGMPRVQRYQSTEADAADAYYNAIAGEDPERMAFIEQRIEIDGLDMEKVRSGLKTGIRADFTKDRLTEDAAKELLVQHAGMTARDAAEALLKWSYEKEVMLGYDDMKADYIAGAFSRSDAVGYRMKYCGESAKEAEETLAEWDAEKETGYAYGKTKEYYLEGDMSRAEAKRYLTEYKAKSAEEAEAQLLTWDYEAKTGRSWSELKQDYLDGTVTEAQVRSYLAEYGGKDADEIDETLSGYDYARLTGREGSAPKYWRIGYAAEAGSGLAEAADAAFEAIMSTGKSWSQARSQIAGSLKSYFIDEYEAVRGTAEGERMLDSILDAYEAIGYPRAYEMEYIEKNWF